MLNTRIYIVRMLATCSILKNLEMRACTLENMVVDSSGTYRGPIWCSEGVVIMVWKFQLYIPARNSRESHEMDDYAKRAGKYAKTDGGSEGGNE